MRNSVYRFFARPANATGKVPGVIVVHENRGLNPYIEDVARRVALAGFVAFAPDALYPLGGYPVTRVAELTAGGMSAQDAEAKVNADFLAKYGTPEDKAKGASTSASKWDEQGVAMQRTLDGAKVSEDFVAATKFLQAHPACNGSIGVTGFCFGGGMVNRLAVASPDLNAAVAYYGPQPPAAQVPNIKAALLLHYAGEDERIDAGIPAYEAALKANNKSYAIYMYPGVQHAFNNDTGGARYNKAAADLAWSRTLAFFREKLGAPPKGA